MNKRGDVLTDNLIGVLIAVAAVGFLILLMFKIFSPTQTVPELTAENYLDSLKIALDEAKEAGSSEFLMYSSEPNPYFLVYFGEGYSFNTNLSLGNFCEDICFSTSECNIDVSFQPKKAKSNNLCVCYIDNDQSIKNFDISNTLMVYCDSCIQEKINSSFSVFESSDEAISQLTDKGIIYTVSGYPINILYFAESKSYGFNVFSSESSKVNKIDCL